MLCAIADAIASIATKYTRISGSQTLNHGLITDLTNTIIVGAEQEGNTQIVCIAITDTVAHLSQQVDLRTDVSPPPTSSKWKGDDGPLTPRTATRGLGNTGSMPIPGTVAAACTHQLGMGGGAYAAGGTSRGTATETLAKRMA